MYINLKIEMTRKSVSVSEISKLLGVHENSISNKIRGKTKFTIEEAFTIRDKYFPECSFEYLFAKPKQTA